MHIYFPLHPHSDLSFEILMHRNFTPSRLCLGCVDGVMIAAQNKKTNN